MDPKQLSFGCSGDWITRWMNLTLWIRGRGNIKKGAEPAPCIKK